MSSFAFQETPHSSPRWFFSRRQRFLGVFFGGRCYVTFCSRTHTRSPILRCLPLLLTGCCRLLTQCLFSCLGFGLAENSVRAPRRTYRFFALKVGGRVASLVRRRADTTVLRFLFVPPFCCPRAFGYNRTFLSPTGARTLEDSMCGGGALIKKKKRTFAAGSRWLRVTPASQDATLGIVAARACVKIRFSV